MVFLRHCMILGARNSSTARLQKRAVPCREGLRFGGAPEQGLLSAEDLHCAGWVLCQVHQRSCVHRDDTINARTPHTGLAIILLFQPAAVNYLGNASLDGTSPSPDQDNTMIGMHHNPARWDCDASHLADASQKCGCVSSMSLSSVHISHRDMTRTETCDTHDKEQ